MKYVNHGDFETISNALNFSTSDLIVNGGCDLFITKAGKYDKKLYKQVEKSLEDQHESLLRLSASLSPPQSQYMNLNLSRSSPFGPLSEVGNRRTFAFLIATLNATHTDYEFMDVLRPTDFVREDGLQPVMNEIDDLLYNLRPRSIFDPVTVAHSWSGGKKGTSKMPDSPIGTPAWNGRMWTMMDQEMMLTQCEIYRYSPREDPFEHEGAVWSHHFFFYNKMKKRVAYFYVQGLSVATHSPDMSYTTYLDSEDSPLPRKSSARSKRARDMSTYSISVGDYGATKRAKYWLGDQVDLTSDDKDEQDDSNDAIAGSWDETSGYTLSENGSIIEGYSDVEDDEIEHRFRRKSSSRIRDVTDEMTETMEL